MKAERADELATEALRAEEGSDEQHTLLQMLLTGAAVNLARIADAAEDLARIAEAGANMNPAYGPLNVSSRYKHEFDKRTREEGAAED